MILTCSAWWKSDLCRHIRASQHHTKSCWREIKPSSGEVVQKKPGANSESVLTSKHLKNVTIYDTMSLAFDVKRKSVERSLFKSASKLTVTSKLSCLESRRVQESLSLLFTEPYWTVFQGLHCGRLCFLVGIRLIHVTRWINPKITLVFLPSIPGLRPCIACRNILTTRKYKNAKMRVEI